MSITIDATYEDGVLKPAQPLPLKEHQRVEVVIRIPQGFPGAPAPAVPGRQEALERLFSLELPVANWNQMEQEIIRGAIE